MCSAINEIDSSALESLETINQRLASAGVTLHLSEVKGPVMDRLKRSHFLDDLTGRIFLSQFAAASALDGGLSGNAATKKDDAALDDSAVHDPEATDDRNDAPAPPQGTSSKDPVSAT
jgi:sulfate permease, SulP family